MEFLESIAKPIENLPSAEVQLERREAERAGWLTKLALIYKNFSRRNLKLTCELGFVLDQD